jgi:hypothetical protein
VHSDGIGSTGEFSITLIKSSQIWVLSTTFMICFALQEKYAEVVTKIHGEGFNWENEPICSQVVYVSGGGKAHAR